MSKKYLVTGAAGFIASQVSIQLLDHGNHVVGLDNLNNYYDVRLKNRRIEQLKAHPNTENFFNMFLSLLNLALILCCAISRASSKCCF